MTFQQKLELQITKKNSLLCIGLDSDIEKIPVRFKRSKTPQYDFNKYVVDQTHDLVCSYKINSAFYESHGLDGISELRGSVDYIRETYPEIPIILDFKRGDIENSNDGYAQFAFDLLHVDGVTVQPYLGKDSLGPFLRQKNKGIFILCRTSNPTSGEFQNLEISKSSLPADSTFGGKTLYEYVAYRVANDWNKSGNCYLVVGATFPEELKLVREIVGDMTILVPGVGAQGGVMEKTIQAGLNSKKRGILLNSSRQILFSDDPRKEAIKLRDTINSFR